MYEFVVMSSLCFDDRAAAMLKSVTPVFGPSFNLSLLVKTIRRSPVPASLSGSIFLDGRRPKARQKSTSLVSVADRYTRRMVESARTPIRRDGMNEGHTSIACCEMNMEHFDS